MVLGSSPYGSLVPPLTHTSAGSDVDSLSGESVPEFADVPAVNPVVASMRPEFDSAVPTAPRSSQRCGHWECGETSPISSTGFSSFSSALVAVSRAFQKPPEPHAGSFREGDHQNGFTASLIRHASTGLALQCEHSPRTRSAGSRTGRGAGGFARLRLHPPAGDRKTRVHPPPRGGNSRLLSVVHMQTLGRLRLHYHPNGGAKSITRSWLPLSYPSMLSGRPRPVGQRGA